MKYLLLILLFSFTNVAFSQRHDSGHARTFKVRKKPALKMAYSRSNSIYMGMSNLVKIMNVDSTLNDYSLSTNSGPVTSLGFNKFYVFALRPGKIKLTLYEKSAYDSVVVDTMTTMVKELSNPRLAIGGRLIEYAVSDSMLLAVQKLEILPDSDVICSTWLHVSSFNIRINGRIYSSETDKLSLAMINALLNAKGQRVDFMNILMAGNGTLEPLKDVIGIIIVN